jgi:DNA-binding transcriptional MerR regulator
MRGYSARDVAKMLDLSVGQIRSYARAGFLKPRRGTRGEYRFSFQDLVLLRTAKGLMAARIPPAKVKRALRRLKRQLPTGRPLCAVQILAEGDRVVVREGDTIWSPESGQTQFNFEVAELVEKVAPHARIAVEQAREAEEALDGEDWYSLGVDLEAAAPGHAREAYRRALELDPLNAAARINLGRLLHEEGQILAAESHYRMALTHGSTNATALFNLGVSLEDLGRRREAMQAYREAINLEPEFADAHYNLARLLEQSGETKTALHHLKLYRKLTGEG